jgi:hypothetical protein
MSVAVPGHDRNMATPLSRLTPTDALWTLAWRVPPAVMAWLIVVATWFRWYTVPVLVLAILLAVGAGMAFVAIGMNGPDLDVKPEVSER